MCSAGAQQIFPQTCVGASVQDAAPPSSIGRGATTSRKLSRHPQRCLCCGNTRSASGCLLFTVWELCVQGQAQRLQEPRVARPRSLRKPRGRPSQAEGCRGGGSGTCTTMSEMRTEESRCEYKPTTSLALCLRGHPWALLPPPPSSRCLVSPDAGGLTGKLPQPWPLLSFACGLNQECGLWRYQGPHTGCSLAPPWEQASEQGQPLPYRRSRPPHA